MKLGDQNQRSGLNRLNWFRKELKSCQVACGDRFDKTAEELLFRRVLNEKDQILEKQQMTTEARFAKLLSATPDQLARIDGVLEGTLRQELVSIKLFTLSSAARKIGVSRATIWRMVKDGSVRTVKIRENARRIAESELIRIARGEPLKGGQ